MKQTIDLHQFRSGFINLRPNNFTYKALGSLFEHLEGLEADTGQEMEYDVIAICCDYNEWEDLAEFNSNHDLECETLDEVREHTTVIEVYEYRHDGLAEQDNFITQAF